MVSILKAMETHSNPGSGATAGTAGTPTVTGSRTTTPMLTSSSGSNGATATAAAAAATSGGVEFGSGGKERLSESQRCIQMFWPAVMSEMQEITHVEPGNQVLPLARIKKIMKLDEDVKMISSDAPLLFAKAIEIFIHELTLRAWLHTEHNKRRTLQRSDIAMAITKYDQFDFLIDIVPREEIKVYKKEYEVKAVTSGGPATPGSTGSGAGESEVQYYLQLAQTHHQALQQATTGTKLTTATPVTVNGGGGGGGAAVLELATPTTNATEPSPGASNNESQATSAQSPTGPGTIQGGSAPNNIIFSNSVATGASGNPVPVQLFQHVLTQSGEITQIPISIPQSPLNFLRAAGGAAGTAGGSAQPFFIQAAPMGAGPTIIHTTPAGVFLSASQLHQLQQQQQQQQQQQTQSVQQQRD